MKSARRKGGTLCLFTEIFASHGGMQNYNRDQVQAILRCDPEGPLQALVLNDPQVPFPDEWRGVAASGFQRRKLRFARASVAAAGKAQPERILLGHRQFLPMAPLIKAAAPRSSIWLMLYGIDAWESLSTRERLALRFVDRVLSISPYTAERFSQAGFKKRIDLWPCSLPFFWKMPQPSPPAFHPPCRMLSVSRLSPHEQYKGIDTTIQAVGMLAGRGVPVELHVAGTGGDLPRLTALAEENGVSDRIFFHGRVSDEDLQALYASCDLFVLPSGGEGFGIVFLEAMAYGKPVIGADAAASPFVVRPGTSGYLVRYGDPQGLSRCIEDRISEPEESRAMGLRSREFLQRTFTFEAMTRNVAGLLREVP